MSGVYRIALTPKGYSIYNLNRRIFNIQKGDGILNFWREHMHNTSLIACLLGEFTGLSNKDIRTLKTAAEFHDIGKFLIKDQYILEKRGKLTKSEFKIIKCHAHLGADYLLRAGFDEKVVETVLYHHEKWDGSGYPDGLVKEDIPLFSRILTIADTFDALTSKRPYRNTVGPFQALKEIHKCAGSQFDPNLVKIFLKCWTIPEKQKEVMTHEL
jgi:putative nucleotidyltransferase with HDIG domain